MKYSNRASSFVWIAPVLLLLGFVPQHASAHGTNYRILDSGPAIVVEFIYADNQPMRYAEVLVYSPEETRVEYQNGRTDMNGRFAFFPQAPGEWRIQADDGTGHLERVAIEITPGDNTNGWEGIQDRAETSTHHHDHLPRTWGIILGISLILNVFMGFYLVKTRRG